MKKQSSVVGMMEEIKIDVYFMGFYDTRSWKRPVLKKSKAQLGRESSGKYS